MSREELPQPLFHEHPVRCRHKAEDQTCEPCRVDDKIPLQRRKFGERERRNGAIEELPVSIETTELLGYVE